MVSATTLGRTCAVTGNRIALEGRGSMSVSIFDRPRSHRRDFRRGETVRFRVFAYGVIALDVLLLVVLAIVTEEWRSITAVDLCVWTALVAFAGLVPLNSGHGPSLAMDLPLLLAAAFVFDPFA